MPVERLPGPWRWCVPRRWNPATLEVLVGSLPICEGGGFEKRGWGWKRSGAAASLNKQEKKKKKKKEPKPPRRRGYRGWLTRKQWEQGLQSGNFQTPGRSGSCRDWGNVAGSTSEANTSCLPACVKLFRVLMGRIHRLNNISSFFPWMFSTCAVLNSNLNFF